MIKQLIRILILSAFTLNCTSFAQEKTSVKIVAEVLIEQLLTEIEGRKIGLVMNPTARIENIHVLDTLLSLDVNVTALFSPEHGFRGQFSDGEIIEDGIDQQTGLPVYSLYGSTKKPTHEMLEDIDLLLFDMQDVGARFYTFNSTMRYVIEAATELNIEVWILDRPNPIGGEYVSGWVLDPEFESMVGTHQTPVAHGMTLGELAMMGIGEQWYDLQAEPNLRIIQMEGWERSYKWPDTGLTWFPPSPNLPTFEHAYVYLGTCFIEGTTISEGRGTQNPFLNIGAPDYEIDMTELVKIEEEFSVQLDTLNFTPISIPGKSMYPKHQNEKLYGIKIKVKDGFSNPVEFGISITNHFMRNSKSSEYREYMNLLTGYDAFSGDSLTINWDDAIVDFKEKRKEYLLYQ